MSNVKVKKLPGGENLYTTEGRPDGEPDIQGFVETLERMLASHPGETYIEIAGYLRRPLVERLIFLLGIPKGGVN